MIATDFDDYSPLENLVAPISKLLTSLPTLREVRVYVPEETGDDGSSAQETILRRRFPGAKINYIM